MYCQLTRRYQPTLLHSSTTDQVTPVPVKIKIYALKTYFWTAISMSFKIRRAQMSVHIYHKTSPH